MISAYIKLVHRWLICLMISAYIKLVHRVVDMFDSKCIAYHRVVGESG